MRSQPGFRKGTWLARDVITSTNSSGQSVLLHLPSSTYFALDGSAARIVALLNEVPSQPEAAVELAREVGIPLERAMSDVAAVVSAVQGMKAPRVNRGRVPTASGSRFVLRAWYHLPWQHKVATAQAAVVVAFVEVGLSLSTLSRLASLIGVPLETDRMGAPKPAPDDLDCLTEKELRAHWAVQWVLRHWLFDGTCLRWALTFGWFLRRRHPVLRLGLIDELGNTAHAWIEADGHAFNTTAIAEVFVSAPHSD